MKKLVLITLTSVSVLFAVMVVFNLQAANGSKESKPTVSGTALPDSIHKFVQRACMDCHSDDGNFMAKGKVNFSGWDKYDASKQMDKAKEICKEVSKNSMPPGKWRKNNPDKLPTPAEVEMICKWANSLQK